MNISIVTPKLLIRSNQQISMLNKCIQETCASPKAWALALDGFGVFIDGQSRILAVSVPKVSKA